MQSNCDTYCDDYPLTDSGKLAARQINWLKNISEKCRHLNLCQWGRQKEYKSVCGQNTMKKWTNFAQMENNGSAMKQTNLLSEKTMGLGEDPTKPVNCKSNPIHINKYTNEAVRAPKGLYCVGPLVGDNFVRFIPGGRLMMVFFCWFCGFE